jgi:hypothetical protein
MTLRQADAEVLTSAMKDGINLATND